MRYIRHRPLVTSCDHRIVDGADAARPRPLASLIAGPRRMILRPAARPAWAWRRGRSFLAVGAVGVVSWLVPLELVALSRPLLKDRRLRVSPTRISGDVVMAVLLAALAHIAFPRVTAFGEMPFGGAVGDLFGLRGVGRPGQLPDG